MKQPINLAAIDIGSNGARQLIKRFDEGAAVEAFRACATSAMRNAENGRKDFLKCDTIIVPNISLADSIVDGLARNMADS